MTSPALRLGVAGLGRAFMLMLPTLRADPRLALVAAADPREAARQRFQAEFGGAVYPSVDALCADPHVDAVYIATPHQYHAEHVVAAARAGRHVVVEKPMALTLDECDVMIEATRAARAVLIVGPSHSFDAPILRTRALIAGGAYGRVRMIHALNYTDFLYRPRRPEELETSRGGGVVFSQAAHQVDVARLIAGSPVRSVRAVTGAWDARRPTEGAYAALLTFDDGAFASLTYSGYAHFDSDELQGWIGEMGQRKDPDQYGGARALTRQARTAGEETSLKMARTYGTVAASGAAPVAHNHFGVLIVSCEGADLRPTPDGVHVYADDRRHLEPVPLPAVPRVEVIDELYGAVVLGRAPFHTGEWARDTLAASLAILESARAGRDMAPRSAARSPGGAPVP